MKRFNKLPQLKKYKFLFLTLLMLIPALSYSQWISNYYGMTYGDTPLGNAHGMSVTVDNYGFCYVTGYVDENNGTGNNILVVKYNPQTGDTIWTASYDGSAHAEDIGYGIKTDAIGNVYVVGTVSNEGKSYDAALLKYNSSGNLIWAQFDRGGDFPGADQGVDMVIDVFGNIYITGFCTMADNKRYVITDKYSPDGTLKWSKKIIGADNIQAEGVAVAINGYGTKIYVTGYLSGSTSGDNIFLLSYYTFDGTQAFLKDYNGYQNASDRAFGIAVDEQDNVIITGYVTNSLTNDNDIVTLKYNQNGNLVWHREYNGGGSSSDRAFGIVVDEDRFIYVTGYSTNAAGNRDYVTLCYDRYGNQKWVTEPYNGPGNNDDEAQAIGIVTNQNNTRSIIVTGSSWGTTNNHDYATVWYDIQTGALQAAERYSMTTTTEDVAKDLAVSSVTDDAYITGFSQLLGNSPVSMCAVSTQKLGQFEGSKLTANNNIPSQFNLMQNYPNPFNPSTTIKFTTSEKSDVKLTVYDITGREVNVLINQTLNAGTYEINFVTQALSSGVYFYELRAGAYRDVKKMTYIK